MCSFASEARFPIEDEFLASAALTLKTRVFCRSEYIPPDVLAVIERGIAAKNGRIKTRGSVLAEDIVLSTDTFRDLDPAVALTFVVQVAGIEKKHLEELMKEFPKARKKIRIATFKLAFCRAMVAISQACATEMYGTGVRIDMIEALNRVRSERSKLQLRLRDPSKRVLANSVEALGQRVDAGHEELRSSLAAMQAAIDKLPGLMRPMPSRSGDVERPPRRKKQFAPRASASGALGGAASLTASLTTTLRRPAAPMRATDPSAKCAPAPSSSKTKAHVKLAEADASDASSENSVDA